MDTIVSRPVVGAKGARQMQHLSPEEIHAQTRHLQEMWSTQGASVYVGPTNRVWIVDWDLGSVQQVKASATATATLDALCDYLDRKEGGRG